jgi:hypothetical protein
MRRLDDEFTCLFVDLQKAESAEDAIVELSLAVRPHESLWNKTKHVFRNAFHGVLERVEELDVGEVAIKLRNGLTEARWTDKGGELLEVLAAAEKPVILFLDELPIMVNRMLGHRVEGVDKEGRERADLFMSWLRESVLRHNGQIRFVVAGSIGLGPVLRRANISATINHLDPFELPPWSEDAAVGCLCELAKSYGLKLAPDVALEMVRRLGCPIPHHVQMFFTKARDHCIRTEQPEFLMKEVELVYQRDMLSVRGHAELVHYEERLRQVLEEKLYPIALDLLTEAAVVGVLTPAAITALGAQLPPEDSMTSMERDRLLEVLEHDGYLQRCEGGFRFVSTLLHDWWKQRYGLFHTPIEDR